jgi:hypothetical protein
MANAKKVTLVCWACGKGGHASRKVLFAGKIVYTCPLLPGWGKTGTRKANGHCSNCGGACFAYSPGMEVSDDGVRGYRCLQCYTVNPELSA